MTDVSDTEKTAATRQQEDRTPSEDIVDLDEIGEVNGYITDVNLIEDKSLVDRLKLAKDGQTILIPQPSDDPEDPLNWTWFRKHLTLIIISMTAFLPDYGSATGAVALIPQAA